MAGSLALVLFALLSLSITSISAIDFGHFEGFHIPNRQPLPQLNRPQVNQEVSTQERLPVDEGSTIPAKHHSSSSVLPTRPAIISRINSNKTGIDSFKAPVDPFYRIELIPEKDVLLVHYLPVDRQQLENGTEKGIVEWVTKFLESDMNEQNRRVFCWSEPKINISSNTRQLSFSNGDTHAPVDFLSRLQRGLMNGKTFEGHLNLNFGVALPTKVSEKNDKASAGKDVEKPKGGDQKGKKKVTMKLVVSLQKKVDEMAVALYIVNLVFSIFESLLKLVREGGAAGSRSSFIGALEATVKALAGLSK